MFRKRVSRSATPLSALLIGLPALVLVVAVVALCVGAVPIAPAEILRSLTGRGSGFTHDIIMNVRLPRVLAAVVAGAALGLCGPVLHATYANPLVDAGVIVVGPAAAVGSAVTLALAPGNIVWAAIAGVVCAALAAIGLSRVRLSGAAFALLGAAAGSAALSTLGLLVSIPQLSAGRSVTSWVFGSLAVADWRSAAVVTTAVALGITLLVRESRDLDIALLGATQAELLGVNVRAKRIRWAIAAAVLAGTVVACFGVIAFVGLAVPHALRAWGVRLHATLLAASAFGGAALLLASDMLARTLIPHTEIAVGFVVTAIGAPLLAVSLSRAARHG